MTDTIAKPNPADLPETFTIADLEKTFDPSEIEALREDDPEMFSEPAEKPAEGADDAATVDDDPAAAARAAEQDAAKATPAADDDHAPALVDIPDTTAAAARLAEIKAERAALREKYDNGEMTSEEMDQATEKLIDDQVSALAEIKRAEGIAASNQTSREAAWNAALEGFKAQGNEALFGDDHVAGFDKALRTVTNFKENPENASLPFSVLISMAAQQHAIAYQTRTGKALVVRTAKGNPAAGTGVEGRRGPRTDPRPDPIDTLSGLNAPGDEMVQESRFGAIDKIAERDPEEAERMLSSMTPAERDRYLDVGY